MQSKENITNENHIQCFYVLLFFCVSCQSLEIEKTDYCSNFFVNESTLLINIVIYLIWSLLVPNYPKWKWSFWLVWVCIIIEVFLCIYVLRHSFSLIEFKMTTWDYYNSFLTISDNKKKCLHSPTHDWASDALHYSISNLVMSLCFKISV